MNDPISDFFYKWTEEQRTAVYAKTLEASNNEMRKAVGFND